LDNILSGILKLNKTKFVDNVCNNYNRNVEPLTSWIKEIIRKKQFSSVYEWKRSFLKQKYSLTFEYLPFLSLLYNLIVIPCIVEYHPDHNHVFVPIKEVFDLSKGSAKASVYVVTEQTSDFEHIRPIKAIFVTSEVSLNYIYNQLEVATDQNTKAYLKSQIALYHRRQAEKIDKTHHLDALKGWNHAKNFYNDSLKLNPNNLTAILGYATCLIMLCKYKLAEKVLNENLENRTQFRESPERWFLLGVLKRKLHDYDEAKNAVENAFRLKKNYAEANNELAFIEKLQQETVAKRMKIYKKLSLNHVEPNSQQYNILSIDGGGIRGLIPAVWLSELERRTQLSSSSMFHMMAGTSTGAIVAASLSLPDKSDERRSRYKAVNIVELYTNHSNGIFSRASVMQHFFGLWPKYTNEGRQTVFNEYFGDTRLSQTLTDLIVTTVNSGGNTTELFRRSESLTDPSKDYKLADVLMCTTAAPTYFPPYKLNGSVFVDGGVQANNPAMIAYADARGKTANRENILVLSLGTGDYVPDPLKPNAERSLLFWIANNTNVLKVIFDGPQNNIDQQLSNILDSDTYHRWQVWLENPIVLDDIKKETLDKLMELAHIHFEEMDAFDNDNRLGKLIERLKGQ
jgi:predicted acylesterase/phospholipase RssA